MSEVNTSFEIGQRFRETFAIDLEVIEEFARLSGDTNPLHMVESEAQSFGYARQVAHGAILVAFVSRMIGMTVPGSGAVWMSHSVDWLLPVYVGDEVTVEVEVLAFSSGIRVLNLAITALNQKGKEVMKGIAKVKIAERISMIAHQSHETEERVALVTGGSRGLGAEIARRLSELGMRVGVAYHASKTEAERVVKEVSDSGSAAVAVQADLRDPRSAGKLVAQTIDCFGRLDVVVHAATQPIVPAPLLEQDYAAIQEFFNSYVGAADALVKASAPGMKERKFGRFVFLGTSYLYSTPPNGLTAYITAKEGLWGFVKSAAVELGPLGITCNMVSPGMTVTDLTDHIPARLKEVEARKNPMRRLASKADTAHLVGFLAGGAAGYINGANLPVCGGPL